MKAAEAWKKATDEEKAPHVAAAEQEKEVYERLSVECQEKKEAASKQEAQALARTFMTSQVTSANSKIICWNIPCSLLNLKIISI